MLRWAFVDDQEAPAAAFAQELSDARSGIMVVVVTPEEARENLLAGKEHVDGVLMDVDLSDLPGEHGSGPGIAQDIRINQENGRLPPFPVVRFSSRQKVLANIGGDASSDDLFDLKIDKEVVVQNVEAVRNSLTTCSEIYGHVDKAVSFAPADLANFLGLTLETLEGWTHPEFIARAEAARSDRPHIAARLIMRLLTQPGPLIREELLAVRLGVNLSSAGWTALKLSLAPLRYAGKGDEHFSLWWARGLEDWWLDHEGAGSPLSSMTIAQRIEQLHQTHEALSPVVMPPESPGNRPWCLCALSLEDADPSLVPVDPAFGVRVVTRESTGPWFDPAFAAFGVALQKKEDRRLSRSDLQRHEALWKQ